MKKQNVINELLSGHGSWHRKYRGRHVLVAGRKVVALRRGLAGLKEFQKMTRKYGKPPVVLFVPPDDVTYILSLCL